MTEIKELMNRRMRGILIHACLYYTFNYNIISDAEYDKRGLELMELIKKYPQHLDELEFGSDFKNYIDCPSAFNLNYRDPRILNRAYHLMLLHKNR